jgi:predicted RNase H-like HicB family nuclease
MNTTRHEHEEVIATGGREFACLFRRDAAGGYLVTCRTLPPVLAFGETLDEARDNARAEIEAWLDTREVSETFARKPY